MQKPERFPQRLEMGSLYNSQAGSDRWCLFTHTLHLLVWNNHQCLYTEGALQQLHSEAAPVGVATAYPRRTLTATPPCSSYSGPAYETYVAEGALQLLHSEVAPVGVAASYPHCTLTATPPCSSYSGPSYETYVAEGALQLVHSEVTPVGIAAAYPHCTLTATPPCSS